MKPCAGEGPHWREAVHDKSRPVALITRTVRAAFTDKIVFPARYYTSTWDRFPASAFVTRSAAKITGMMTA